MNGNSFLLYSPLNQGLKPTDEGVLAYCAPKFLLYSPLNQGLKLSEKKTTGSVRLSFYSTVH